MKHVIVAAVFSACALANSAYADNTETVHSEASVEAKDGAFKSKVTSEAVDATGSKTDYERTQSAKSKLLGGTEVSTREVIKTDPKGMLNTSTETREVSTEVDRKGNYEHSKSAKTVDRAGATTTHDVSQKISHDGKKVETTETKVVDPKGLLNKKTTEATSVVETQKDGSLKSEYEEKVNGEVVQSGTGSNTK